MELNIGWDFPSSQKELDTYIPLNIPYAPWRVPSVPFVTVKESVIVPVYCELCKGHPWLCHLVVGLCPVVRRNPLPKHNQNPTEETAWSMILLYHLLCTLSAASSWT